MNKKGQMIGQIFVLVIAAIVFILILGYGYSAISNFIKNSEQITLLEFKTSLTAGVEQIKSDYGSVRKISLRIPKIHHELCIISSDINEDTGDFQSKHPVLFEIWQTGSENVFLIPKQDSPLFIDAVVVPNGYFCVKVSGIIDLKVKGLGDKAEVSVW